MRAQPRASQGLSGREGLRIWSSSSFELGIGPRGEGGRGTMKAWPNPLGAKLGREELRI